MPLGVLFGASRVPLEASFGPPGGVLGLLLGLLGPSGSLLDASWSLRGSHESHLAPLGSLVEPLWDSHGGLLGSCVSPWEPRGASFGASWRLLGSCASCVGSSLSESAENDGPLMLFDGFSRPQEAPRRLHLSSKSEHFRALGLRRGSTSECSRAFSSAAASKRLVQ